jgi:hypothetical protein
MGRGLQRRTFLFVIVVLSLLYFVSFIVSMDNLSGSKKLFPIQGDLTVYYFYGEGCLHCAEVDPFGCCWQFFFGF